MSQQPLDLPVSSRRQGVIDYCYAVLVAGLSITRYPFCVLVSAIGWCGALSDIVGTRVFALVIPTLILRLFTICSLASYAPRLQ